LAGTKAGCFYGPAGTCDLEADREPGYQVAPHRDSAMNGGLRAMGVQAAPGVDEYETIGLTAAARDHRPNRCRRRIGRRRGAC